MWQYEHTRSPPTRGRGSKRSPAIWRARTMSVAPYAGAWIETYRRQFRLYVHNVAPYAGAWIETLSTVLCSALRLVAPYAGRLFFWTARDVFKRALRGRSIAWRMNSTPAPSSCGIGVSCDPARCQARFPAGDRRDGSSRRRKGFQPLFKSLSTPLQTPFKTLSNIGSAVAGGRSGTQPDDGVSPPVAAFARRTPKAVAKLTIM